MIHFGREVLPFPRPDPTDFAPFRDVFASDFRLSPRVAIVAPGPNGRGHYREIPDGCSVIAVSKAVLIPEIEADVWMMNHADQEWYPEASAAFRGVRVFGDRAVLDAAPALAGADAEGWYYFLPPPETLDPEVLRPIDGCIRLGGSVTGCAVQLAYNFGAREILLCGADMSGDGYWDGTSNVHPTHGDTWPVARALNLMTRWLRDEKGVAVSTLSPTRLDLPYFRPPDGP